MIRDYVHGLKIFSTFKDWYFEDFGDVSHKPLSIFISTHLKFKQISDDFSTSSHLKPHLAMRTFTDGNQGTNFYQKPYEPNLLR